MNKNQIIKEIIWWVKSVVIIFAITFVITQKIIVLANVTTGSMMNTIQD